MKKNIIISVLIIIIGGLLVYIGYDKFYKGYDEFKTNNEEQDDMLIIPYKGELAGIYETNEIFRDNKVQITLNGNDIILDYNNEEDVLYVNSEKVNLEYDIAYILITAYYVVGFHGTQSGYGLSILIEENGKTIDLMEKVGDFQFTSAEFLNFNTPVIFYGHPWCGMEFVDDSCPSIDVTIFKDDNGKIKINKEIDE